MRVGVSSGAIQALDHESCNRKEIALLRAMEGTQKLPHCSFLRWIPLLLEEPLFCCCSVSTVCIDLLYVVY